MHFQQRLYVVPFWQNTKKNGVVTAATLSKHSFSKRVHCLDDASFSRQKKKKRCRLASNTVLAAAFVHEWLRATGLAPVLVFHQHNKLLLPVCYIWAQRVTHQSRHL